MDKSELLQQLRLDDAARDTGKQRGYRVVLIVTLVLLSALLGLWYWTTQSNILTLQAATAQLPSKLPGETSVLDATGYVTARRQATVSAKTTGQVTELLIEEGQRVAAGQVLARLDDRDAHAQLELARAQRDAARAELADLRLLLTQAERDYARQQDLVARKLTTRQAADDARTLVATRRARIVSQQRQVDVAERRVEVAEVTLQDTVVKAPFAGVITVKAAQPGEIVSPLSAGGGFTRTGIGTIVDMDSLEIEVEVNEAYIGRVQADQPVRSTLNAYPDWAIPGHVIAIIPAADRSKATVKVRISIDQQDPRILPDMGVRVAFLENAAPHDTGSSTTTTAKGVLVPASAIRSQGDQSEVFIWVDGRVHSRRVILGQTYADLRQILEGLTQGERVILAPPAQLQDGDKVRLAAPNE